MGELPQAELADLSAWLDGELPGKEWDAVWQACEASGNDSLEAWHSYHLIGDVLRSSGSASAAVTAHTSAQRSCELARQIMAKAKARPLDGSDLQPLPAVPAQSVISTVPLPHRREAANDGVFRWKLVSGLASLVAVVTLAWGMAGLPAAGHAPGPVLAQAVPAVSPVAESGNPPVQTVGLTDAPVAVLVSTPHGQVLRDPRLEALMRAHRQASGASALQVPAGFLRSATFDATQR